ncbi:MAG: hypothetical protein KKB91_05975 [Proteobacteria bacterium]|nr:hypothetical protein [Desulfocapsa sp.]MBU3943120.1 hypothetical protein [Pseudomonadota bacterium]MCG2745698.1 hypothetical protein [Desulfobacteraceae bacterium]MBU3983872.1 hypothetical protein [Pseudomonadota bacterium]MBU4041563.1 hypothetical protein [Pseudomonadota bacterium]
MLEMPLPVIGFKRLGAEDPRQSKKYEGNSIEQPAACRNVGANIGDASALGKCGVVTYQSKREGGKKNKSASYH